MLSRAITKPELLDLFEMYSIGRKPLAKLLGWGETTILLYAESEEIPDNEYTRRLYELYTNVTLYVDLLCSHADRLTGVAYRKSLNAVRNLMPHSKLAACANFIINETSMNGHEEMSLLRLETILFWGQIISLCFYGEPMFEDEYHPGESGLPYGRLEECMNRFGCISLELPEDPSGTSTGRRNDRRGGMLTELTLPDKEILCFTTNIFSWYGYEAIRRLMDAEQYRLCGPVGARRRSIVSAETIRKCYSEVFTQGHVAKIKDIEAYLQRRMNFVRKKKQ